MSTCPRCSGYGRIVCPECEGTGRLHELQVVGFRTSKCLKCRESGRITCLSCDGRGGWPVTSQPR